MTRSARDEVGQTCDGDVAIEISRNQQHISVEISPKQREISDHLQIKRRPIWFYQTFDDVHLDEILELGEERWLLRNSVKKYGSCNYALLANIQHSFEPQSYKEAKGHPEWEKIMQVEYDALMKNILLNIQLACWRMFLLTNQGSPRD